MAGSEAEALARRFEPILFFHPQEKFFPADAKRYMEACALWLAEAPFDQKGGWGGRAAPFPKQPSIGKGDIALGQGEPGTPLRPGDNPEVPGEQEHFLELAGWKDAAGASQPAVTQLSQNTYSERDTIARLYNRTDDQGGERKLRESRFRYHAELFETERLRRLLASVKEPDLAALLASFKNAALLCYYFFYPAHEELLEATCSNVEAQEFGCFAGEWSCIAVLLERDNSSGPFRPSLIGYTGRLIPPQSGVSRPQGPDEDDTARRVVMKVSEFSGGTPANPAPDKIGEHPKLFVAKGSHGMYADPGTVEVSYPEDIAPADCGRSDGPTHYPDAPSTFFTNPATFIGKLLAGNAIGLGLGLGPLGAIAGAAWILAEGATLGSGLTVVGQGATDASSDEMWPPGTGKTVKPANLAADPGFGSDVQNWLVRRDEQIDGRKYDFIVDRQTQVWWPKDSGEAGYKGCWGPRVENDPFGRRSGMQMPKFWRMFFMALAKGKAAGTL